MKLYIDSTDSTAPDNWQTIPYADSVVHYDPSETSDSDVYKLIDDSMNARNSDLLEYSIKTLYDLST